VKYKVEVFVNDRWQMAHGDSDRLAAHTRAATLGKQYSQVRIMKRRWLREPVQVWYTNTEIRANDNG
jgi:hypothetical protein